MLVSPLAMPLTDSSSALCDRLSLSSVAVPTHQWHASLIAMLTFLGLPIVYIFYALSRVAVRIEGIRLKFNDLALPKHTSRTHIICNNAIHMLFTHRVVRNISSQTGRTAIPKLLVV